MRPGLFTLVVQRGASLRLEFPIADADGEPWDLTGFTARLRAYDRQRVVQFSLDGVHGDASPTELEVLDDKLILTLSPTTTVSLPGPETPLRYQLDLVDQAADVHRLLVGEVEVHEGLQS